MAESSDTSGLGPRGRTPGERFVLRLPVPAGAFGALSSGSTFTARGRPVPVTRATDRVRPPPLATTVIRTDVHGDLRVELLRANTDTVDLGSSSAADLEGDDLLTATITVDAVLRT